MHPYSVIIKPVLSEKSNEVRENGGQYTFEIRRDATKEDVKKAVSKLWDVKVESSNTYYSRQNQEKRCEL